MAITLKQRVFAGLWFMGAAALVTVPIFFSIANLSRFQDIFWLLVSPPLVSGLVGSVLGANLLDAQRINSWWRAALRGLLVAVVSFLLSAVALSAWVGYVNEGPFSPVESFTRMLTMILIVVGFTIGWMIALVGAGAGWLLHLIATRSREKQSGGMG